jgi:TfoX/Sxy family transcriptional regulator of competence genes
MSYDEQLAERVRAAIALRAAVQEKRLFGGLSFMHRGHLACGITGDELMVRVGPEGYAAALNRAGARPMDFTGRAMKGMVVVNANGIRTKAQLERWVAEAIDHAESLPEKKP